MQLVIYILAAELAINAPHTVNSDSKRPLHEDKQLFDNDRYSWFIGCLRTDEPLRGGKKPLHPQSCSGR